LDHRIVVEGEDIMAAQDHIHKGSSIRSPDSLLAKTSDAAPRTIVVTLGTILMFALLFIVCFLIALLVLECFRL
jgi:hypothetical protein